MENKAEARLRCKSSPWLGAFHLGADALCSLLPLPRKPHILIACMPKSASTFVATSLAQYQGLRRARLVPYWGAREQELSPVRLSRHYRQGYVAQHHLKNSEWTQELARRYRLSQVVLVRDLFDVVASLRDHVRREPLNHVDQFHGYYASLSDSALEEALVLHSLPWYMQFYGSWRGQNGALMVSYEEMVAAPVATLARILTHAGLAADHDKISQAISKGRQQEVRLNVGVTGRGRDISPRARDMLYALLDSYPLFHGDDYIRRMYAQRA